MSCVLAHCVSGSSLLSLVVFPEAPPRRWWLSCPPNLYTRDPAHAHPLCRGPLGPPHHGAAGVQARGVLDGCSVKHADGCTPLRTMLPSSERLQNSSALPVCNKSLSMHGATLRARIARTRTLRGFYGETLASAGRQVICVLGIGCSGREGGLAALLHVRPERLRSQKERAGPS